MRKAKRSSCSYAEVIAQIPHTKRAKPVPCTVCGVIPPDGHNCSLPTKTARERKLERALRALLPFAIELASSCVLGGKCGRCTNAKEAIAAAEALLGGK